MKKRKEGEIDIVNKEAKIIRFPASSHKFIVLDPGRVNCKMNFPVRSVETIPAFLFKIARC